MKSANSMSETQQLITKNKTALVKDLSEWTTIRRRLKADGLTIGFVPTMGALHQGHASLLERARRDNDIVVLSIYVNPTQFDNQDDLAKYPLTLESDLALAAQCGIDFVLLPTFEQIYRDSYRYKVTENDLSHRLCGAHRPGHFDGVLTVVIKLLNLAQPNRAYFGEKDHQQLELIRGMVDAFFIDTEIVACPTLRENDGLAMSSRNRRLGASERALAPLFFAILRDAQDSNQAREQLQQAGFLVDYVEDVGRRRYGAVRLGSVRLIDNVER